RRSPSSAGISLSPSLGKILRLGSGCTNTGAIDRAARPEPIPFMHIQSRSLTSCLRALPPSRTRQMIDKGSALRFPVWANMRLNYRFLVLLPAVGFALLTSCTTTPTGPTAAYHVTAHKPKDASKVRVDLSLSKQNVYVMEGDRCLMAAACSVGLPS